LKAYGAMIVTLVATVSKKTRKVSAYSMKMDAGRCAAVGLSGAGGFERRSTHCVNNLVSVAAAARSRGGTCFSFRARNVPAPVRSAGGE